MLEFEWDEQKAEANVEKHGVFFEEATTAFADPLQVMIDDPDHSDHEQRRLLLGRSSQETLLVVSHIERDGRIRLISARRASRRERRDYEGTQE